MSELFDEVDEDVRRDQLKKLWDQYSIYIIAGALLIIAAVGGWRGYQYLEAQEGGRGGCGLRQGRRAFRAGQAFRGGSGLQQPRCQRAVGLSHAGAAARRGGSRKPRSASRGEIVRRHRGRSQRRRAGSRNLQRSARPDCWWIPRPIPTWLQRLEAEAAAGATFRHTARELLALSAWRANDTTAARKWLDLIANDGETPSSLRSRAEALQALLPPVAKS